jgi:hypothetical protein
MPDATVCRRCGRRIQVNPALSADVFEGMHWLCFHLEYEHEGDPDVPCTDYTSCPWWTIAHLERKLQELGVDPRNVISEAIKRHAKTSNSPSATLANYVVRQGTET